MIQKCPEIIAFVGTKRTPLLFFNLRILWSTCWFGADAGSCLPCVEFIVYIYPHIARLLLLCASSAYSQFGKMWGVGEIAKIVTALFTTYNIPLMIYKRKKKLLSQSYQGGRDTLCIFVYRPKTQDSNPLDQ